MRTTRNDWLALGLELLRDGGEGALTIERLCNALGRTKGSFYHHFEDLAAYHEALLVRWAEIHTELPIQAADGSVDVAQRRAQLYEAVHKSDFALERAVHAWAVWSPAARRATQRVHERRIAYLAALREDGKEARAAAELEYAAFVGALHVYPEAPEAQLRVMTHAAQLEQRRTAAPRPTRASRRG